MTAHELARALLAGPDTVVCLHATEDFESAVADAQNVTRSDNVTWITGVAK